MAALSTYLFQGDGFGTTWEDRKTGSEAQVFRFVRSSAEGRYLKISSSRKDQYGDSENIERSAISDEGEVI